MQVQTAVASASGAIGQVPAGFRVEYTEMSPKQRVERWFFAPLKALGDHKDVSFSIMSLLFPLMERYLRWKCEMDDADKFSQGVKAFDSLGNILGCSNEQAFWMWQIFRNGLLHRGAIRTDDEKNKGYTGALVRDIAGCIEVDGHHLKVNPYVLRDKLIPLFEANPMMWRNEDYELMKEYRVVPK